MFGAKDAAFAGPRLPFAPDAPKMYAHGNRSQKKQYAQNYFGVARESMQNFGQQHAKQVASPGEACGPDGSANNVEYKKLFPAYAACAKHYRRNIAQAV